MMQTDDVFGFQYLRPRRLGVLEQEIWEFEREIRDFWLDEADYSRDRDLGVCTGASNCGHPVLNHLCDHLQNHYQNGPGYRLENALRSHLPRFSATRNVSQKTILGVILEAMRKPRIDPKHVRWFFYRRSLFVQILTLIFDGIWWLISQGSLRAFGCFRRYIRAYFPIRFPVDEKARRLHTFIVGRTGTGKSVLMHHLIRHYLVRNKKPSIVLLDPHGGLARSVARDGMNWRSDRLVYLQFERLNGRYAHFNPFELTSASEQNLNHAQLQFGGAMEQVIGENFTPRQRTLIRACLSIMLQKQGIR